MKRLLDLGGTACYEDQNAVGVSLDGSGSDDEITPRIIADYNRAPFADNTFDEAVGSCYLEEEVDWAELFRLLKPGAKAIVMSCGFPYGVDINEPLADAEAAGFVIEEPYHIGYGAEEDNRFAITAPMIVRKPSTNPNEKGD